MLGLYPISATSISGNFFAVVNADVNLCTEALASQNAVSSATVENNASQLRDDYSRLEFLASQLINANSLVEFIASQLIIASFKDEFLTSQNRVERLIIEFAASQNGIANSIVENLGSQNAFTKTALEFIESLLRAEGAPTENIGTQTVNSSIPSEWLGSQNAMGRSLIENLGSQNSIANLLIENTSSQFRADYVRTESTSSQIINGTGPVEFLSGTKTDSNIRLENLASATIIPSFPMESTEGVSVTCSDNIQIEFVTDIKRDQSCSFEFIAIMAKSDQWCPIEWVEGVSVTCDDLIQVEFIASQNAINLIGGEFQAGQKKDDFSPLEIAASQISVSSVPLEFVESVSVTCADIFPIEFVTAIKADQNINLENIAQTLRDDNCATEFLTSQASSSPITIESILGVSSIVNFNDEFTSVFFKMDAGLQLEFLLQCLRVEDAPFENFILNFNVGSVQLISTPVYAIQLSDKSLYKCSIPTVQHFSMLANEEPLYSLVTEEIPI